MDVLVPKITIWIAVPECHRPGISTREWPRELPLGCCHLRSSLVMLSSSQLYICQRVESPRVRICAKTCSFGQGNKSLLEEFPVHLQVIWLKLWIQRIPLRPTKGPDRKFSDSPCWSLPNVVVSSGFLKRPVRHGIRDIYHICATIFIFLLLSIHQYTYIYIYIYHIHIYYIYNFIKLVFFLASNCQFTQGTTKMVSKWIFISSNTCLLFNTFCTFPT